MEGGAYGARLHRIVKAGTMKRVLIFSLTYHPYVGGAEVAIKEITDRLGNDFEFDMITLRFDKALPKEEKRGNITIHRIGPAVDNPRVSDRNMPITLRLAKILFPFTAFFKALSLDRRNVPPLECCGLSRLRWLASMNRSGEPTIP